jgi:hypothetical protein
MKKTKGFLSGTAFAVVAFTFFALMMSGCGFFTEEGVEDGVLKGSSWVNNEPYTTTRTDDGLRYEWNVKSGTLKFTSDSKVSLQTKGDEMVYYIKTGTRISSSYDETFSTGYKYVYAHAIREGYIESSSGNKTLFSISSDYKTLTWGGKSYSRK